MNKSTLFSRKSSLRGSLAVALAVMAGGSSAAAQSFSWTSPFAMPMTYAQYTNAVPVARPVTYVSPVVARPVAQPTTSTSTSPWSTMTPAPVAFSGAITMRTVGDRVIATSAGQGVWAYSAQTQQWTQLSMQAGSTMMAVDGERMFNVVGTSVRSLDLATGAESLLPSMGGDFVARQGASVLVGNGRVLVLDGASSMSNNGGRVFELTSRQWRPMMNEARMPQRRDATVTRFAPDGTEIDALVFGGRSLNGADAVAAPYLVSSRGLFTRVASSVGAPSARSAHAAVWTGSEIVVWGGQGNGTLNDGARYVPSQDRWLPMAASPLSARRNMSAVNTSRGVLFWGGEDANGQALNDGALYNPSTNTWSMLPSNNLEPRVGAGAAVMGNTVLFVGGSRYGRAMNTVSRLAL